ncbi:MAG: S1 RNA-binding domain-containing protein [Lactobacillaceae bacterium]|jgi:general stress protein 13|nr:S1 RNA-binding domain-containing protein [Lactobacillaceae bacterium]
MAYEVGDVVDGTVTGIQPYGAFVQLDQTTQGLIHISECRSAFIHHVRDELQVGQKITVMVLDIDQYSGKISLSRRTLIDSDDEVLEYTHTNPHLNKRHHHYWTNQHVDLGFKTIANQKPNMVSEALSRLASDKHK